MEELRAAVDAFVLACAEVVQHASKPGPTAIAGALRKLYHAREVLRQKCAELNQKLECAKQQVEVEQAQRFAAAALTPGWLEQGTPGPFDTPNPPLDLNLPDVGMDIDLKL